MNPFRKPRGCDFILREAAGTELFTPEDFSDEQRQIAATTEQFVRNEILPDLERMEDRDFPLVVAKLQRCAELGLFLVDIPEAFGGLELDKSTSMLIAEKLGPTGSFAITCTGQTGIGSLPLVYYGTSEQKKRYLDRLTSGEWIAAYCLTEPDCGSDPLGARTSATLAADGSCYLLTGVKQFITNAAFADLFTVFAKIDGRHFSAFLVERGMSGLSIGIEEKKMGLKGTSTAQVVLDNVRVPLNNLLGEVGRGHKIAFNVLNIGRLKLSATTTGAAKSALAEAASYAVERRQFGRPLADFGAIGEKLAAMTLALFSAESLLYRVAGRIDQRIGMLAPGAEDYLEQYRNAIEEYAAECAMAKVFCSETLALVADEAVQIHGGYGYIRDYPVERIYRDERINRIFEGTNEINRLLIPTLLMRRADSGTLDLWPAVVTAQGNRDGILNPGRGSALFGTEFSLLARLKKLFLLILGAVAGRRAEQEILLVLGDLMITVFALESAILRAVKASACSSPRRRELLQALVRVTTFSSALRCQTLAIRCAAYAVEGFGQAALQSTIARLTSYPVVGLLAAKRQLAQATTEAGGYPF